MHSMFYDMRSKKETCSPFSNPILFIVLILNINSITHILNKVTISLLSFAFHFAGRTYVNYEFRNYLSLLE